MHTRLYRLLLHSYAPYSRMRFACIVEDEKGHYYEGVNVENASYGATICAERNAINYAISQGVRRFKTLYLMNNSRAIIPPCSLCKQSLLEFFDELSIFVLMNEVGKKEQHNFNAILSIPFTKKHLLSHPPHKSESSTAAG